MYPAGARLGHWAGRGYCHRPKSRGRSRRWCPARLACPRPATRSKLQGAEMAGRLTWYWCHLKLPRTVMAVLLALWARSNPGACRVRKLQKYAERTDRGFASSFATRLECAAGRQGSGRAVHDWTQKWPRGRPFVAIPSLCACGLETESSTAGRSEGLKKQGRTPSSGRSQLTRNPGEPAPSSAG